MTSPMSGDAAALADELITPEMVKAFNDAFRCQLGVRHKARFKQTTTKAEQRSAEEMGLRAMLTVTPPSTIDRLRSAAQPQPDAGVGREPSTRPMIAWIKWHRAAFGSSLKQAKDAWDAAEWGSSTERPSARDEALPSEAEIRREAVNCCDELSDRTGDTKFLIRQSNLVEMFAALLHARRSSVRDEALEAKIGTPRMLEAADTLEGEIAVTLAWPNGSETVEKVSQAMNGWLEAALGVDRRLKGSASAAVEWSAE